MKRTDRNTRIVNSRKVGMRSRIRRIMYAFMGGEEV
jgi:hypothetical protein